MNSRAEIASRWGPTKCELLGWQNGRNSGDEWKWGMESLLMITSNTFLAYTDISASLQRSHCITQLASQTTSSSRLKRRITNTERCTPVAVV